MRKRVFSDDIFREIAGAAAEVRHEPGAAGRPPGGHPAVCQQVGGRHCHAGTCEVDLLVRAVRRVRGLSGEGLDGGAGQSIRRKRGNLFQPGKPAGEKGGRADQLCEGQGLPLRQQDPDLRPAPGVYPVRLRPERETVHG